MFPLSGAKVCFGGQIKDVNSLGRSPEAYTCSSSTQSRWASQWEPYRAHCIANSVIPGNQKDWARAPEPTSQTSIDPVGVSLNLVPRTSTRECSPDWGLGLLG